MVQTDAYLLSHKQSISHGDASSFTDHSAVLASVLRRWLGECGASIDVNADGRLALAPAPALLGLIPPGESPSASGSAVAERATRVGGPSSISTLAMPS